MPRKPSGPIPDVYETHPLEKYPYVEIHDWDYHQPTTGRDWHRVSNSAFLNPKYADLNCAERGLLHGLWQYRGNTGLNPPRDPLKAARSINVAPSKHVRSHMKSLERRGFLEARATQKRRDKKRREEKRENPPTPGDQEGLVLVKEPAKKPTPKPPPYSAEFLEFWAAYPRKIGKGAAWKVWKQRKDRPKNGDMLASVEAHKRSEQWTKDGGQYIPHPATFLNQARWEDEPDSADREVWI